jgi:hypothetical protein
MRPAWAGLELTTCRLLSESTTTRLRQPVAIIIIIITDKKKWHIQTQTHIYCQITVILQSQLLYMVLNTKFYQLVKLSIYNYNIFQIFQAYLWSCTSICYDGEIHDEKANYHSGIRKWKNVLLLSSLLSYLKLEKISYVILEISVLIVCIHLKLIF